MLNILDIMLPRVYYAITEKDPPCLISKADPL